MAHVLAAGPVTVHSVHGMGGVGKTQLATEYAHAHATDYDLVWWVAAEETAAIPDQFAALADRLGFSDDQIVQEIGWDEDVPEDRWPPADGCRAVSSFSSQ